MTGSMNIVNRRDLSRDLCAVGAIVALVIIFFYKFVFLGMIPLNADWLVKRFYPWKDMAFACHPAPFTWQIFYISDNQTSLKFS